MDGLGNLSQCMVDGDTGEIGRARRLRRKALVASIFLQGVVILGLLLWPLITLGVLPVQLMFTPLPPFHGARNSAAPPHQTEHLSANRRITVATLLRQPPVIPPHIREAEAAQPLDPNEIGDPLSQGDSQMWIPGGADRGVAPNITRPDGASPKSGPRMISQGVMNASLIHRVQPGYPMIAKAMRLSGTVQLRATIGTNGEVRKLEVLSGNSILAEAALAAVREWRYRPTLLNGTAVEVETEITVNFILN
jgi:protein TonB